jgi:hypothetical protein
MRSTSTSRDQRNGSDFVRERNRSQRSQDEADPGRKYVAECCHPALQSRCETMCKYDCGGILSMKVFEAGSSHRVARDAGRDITHFPSPLTPYLKIEASSCDGHLSHHDTAWFRPVTDPCLYNIRRCRISCECRRGIASTIRYEHDGRVLRPWR